MKRKEYNRRSMFIIGGTLYRIAKPKHYFVKYGGYAFTPKIMDWTWSRLHIKTKTTSYTIDRPDFVKHSQSITTSYGQQLLIKVEYMTEVKQTSVN